MFTLKNYFDPDYKPDYMRVMISHTDMDGAGCYVLEHLIDTIRCVDIYTNRPNEIIDQFDRWCRCCSIADNKNLVLITDLAAKSETLTEFDKRGIDWMLIDHHEISPNDEEYITENINLGRVYHDKRYSGTLNMYRKLKDEGFEFKYEKEVRKFCELVSEYDTGNWDDRWTLGDYTSVSYSMRLQFVFSDLGIVDFINRMVKLLKDHGKFKEYHTDLRDIAMSKYNKMEDYYRLFASSIYYDVLYGHYNIAFVPFMVPMFSVIAKHWLGLHPNVDYIMALTRNRKNVELRTNKDDIDVSAIARRFGGGGHKKAAGFPINDIGINLVDVKSRDNIVSIFSNYKEHK